MTIGVLGGGQLGRMLAEAAGALNLRCKFYDKAADACAGQIAELIVGDWCDEQNLARFAEGCDVITFEWENVPVETARFVERFAPVRPSITALEQTQDRAKEKALFGKLGIPAAPYELVQTEGEFTAALEKLNAPCILKTRRMGYDGKGQMRIDTADDAARLAEFRGKECILEKRVAFDRELSIIAVRGTNGEIAHYNLVENHHSEGILRTTISPAPNVSQTLQSAAESYAKRMLEALNYSGVLAIELFQVGSELLANEFAPRVHNSGHWSIEGAVTSQFENHLRAVCGLPLGSTANRYRCVMTNIIGEDAGVPEPNEKRFVHMYGKQPRPGRKIGHITEIVEPYQ